MKRKLFVIVIALVLAVSVVGASFALYVKSDEKDVTIGYDADAVSLTLGTNAASLTLNDLSPKEGYTSKTITVSLDKSGVAPAAGMQGFFKIEIANVGAGDLASAITASAVVTHKAGADPATTNLDQATLTGTGYACALSDLPESIALTIALNTAMEGFDFANYAEEAITIKLFWTPYDNEAFYLRSAATDWCPDPAMMFEAHDEDEVKLLNVYMAANQEFKITENGNWYSGRQDNDENKAVAAESGNLKVVEEGYYDFYFNFSNHTVWVSKVD